MMNIADETITRLEWNPSEEEMSAYLKREVEMARDNIAKLRASNTPVSGNTLHSGRTLLLATLSPPSGVVGN